MSCVCHVQLTVSRIFSIGEDYTFSDSVVILNADNTQACIVIIVYEDNFVEDDEMVSFTLNSTSSNVIIEDGVFEIIIFNDDCECLYNYTQSKVYYIYIISSQLVCVQSLIKLFLSHTHTVVSFEFNSSKYVVNETVGQFDVCVQTTPGDAIIIQDFPVTVIVIVQDRTTTGNVQ